MTDDCLIGSGVENETNVVDVLIIGAGLSGLTSAVKILQKESSLSVTILEADNKIGGQLRRTSLGEMGGKWINEDQYHVYNMLTKLKVPHRRRIMCDPTFKRCWDLDRGVFAFLVKFELGRYMRELDIKAQLYRPGRCEFPKYFQSMNSHIESKLYFTKSRVFMRNFVQLTSGTEAYVISYQDYMRILYSCNGISNLMRLYLHESPALLEFSSEQLLLALERNLRKAEIVLSAKVCELTHLKDNVIAKDSRGVSYIASAVILAIPINKLLEIVISPKLPKEIEVPPISAKRQVITSFIAKYIESYWRRNGYSGNFISSNPPIYGQEYLPKHYYAVMLHAEDKDHDCLAICLNTLADYYGEEMTHPLACEHYSFEQNSLAFLPQTTPWNRLILSSSSTAGTCYRGCLGGAVQSGLRAAMNTMLILRPQSISWQDVAEIQQPNVVYQRISSITILLSSLNLYNCSFYGLFTFTIIACLKLLTKAKRNN